MSKIDRIMATVTREQLKVAREVAVEMAEEGRFADVDADYVRSEASDRECVACCERAYGHGWGEFLEVNGL